MHGNITDDESGKQLNSFVKHALDKGAIEKIKRLPSASTIRHIEPMVRAIHSQAYWSIVFDMNLSAIHNTVILLEVFLKSLWFEKHKLDSDKELGSMIDRCFSHRIITEKEKNFCKKIKECRDKYVHGNYHRLTEGASVMGVAIPLDENNIEKNMERLENAKKTPIHLQEGAKRYTNKELPVLKELLTFKLADNDAEAIFVDVDAFIRAKSEKIYGKTDIAE